MDARNEVNAAQVNAVLDAVARTAQESPETPAFRAHGARTVTYRELWDTASHLATQIAARALPGSPVVVLGPKSALTVAAFLACLRSGHAFVPMDVSMPQARIRDVAGQIEQGEGGRALIVATTSLPEGLDVAHEVLDAEALLHDGQRAWQPQEAFDPAERASWVTGEQTQYIIFTSGSTGRPKGIEVTANDVANFAGWVRTFPVVRAGGRTFLDQAPYSFDLSEYELVGALTTGGCLYGLSAASHHDMHLLFEELAEANVDVWVSTPSFATMCLVDPSFRAALLPRVGLFLFCGETLPKRTASTLAQRFPRAIVANTYGPTESTVAVTYCEVTPQMLAADGPLPVGRPRPGTQIRIARTNDDGSLGEECAPGETGEIVIVGDTVAKDYYHNPEKTAAAFFAAQLPDGRAVRAYRTGDLGSLRADGMLDYLGRDDSLVKVNGFRIELGDVESNLASLAGVKQAAVVPLRRDGVVKALRGFVTLDHDEPRADETSTELRRRLGEMIPAYMVPRRIVVLKEMPLTPNEKIDRKRLAGATA